MIIALIKTNVNTLMQKFLIYFLPPTNYIKLNNILIAARLDSSSSENCEKKLAIAPANTRLPS